MYANLARIARDYGQGQDTNAVHPQKPGNKYFMIFTHFLDWVGGVDLPDLNLKNMGMISVASAAE